MTDITQGADAPDDAALFREAVDSNTLDSFENPKLEAPPTEKPADKPVEKPVERDDPPIPAGRLREETEARRRVERERDELAARLAALSKPPPQQQQQPKPDAIFEDPNAFVLSVVKPLLEQQEQRQQMERENYSMDRTVQRFGPDVVMHSRQALEYFMQRGDQQAWDTYNRAMKSHDPYGVIAGWYHERSILHEIGGDPDAYRKRVRDEALKDPEYLKTAIEHARKTAAANGSFAHQPPVTQQIPRMPSLGDIGAAGGDAQAAEPSDLELFRAATTAKRR